MLHNIWYWAIKVWNWAFIQIAIIKRGLFWNMTYFYMRQTQYALSNLHWNKIIVGSQLTYPTAMQTLIWEYQKYLRYLNPVRKSEKGCFVCIQFLWTRFSNEVDVKEEWSTNTGMNWFCAVYEPIQKETAVLNAFKGRLSVF